MKKALVLFSGGQDSTTCLYWALKQFDHVEALSFNYEQRHKIELEIAHEIIQKTSVKHHILPINTFHSLGGSSLTDDIPVKNDLESNNLPNTFVPGRNIIFLTFAAAMAYQKNISHLVIGVNQTDYSGYPDCRQETMESIEKTILLGMEYNINIHTPLMLKSKADIWKLSYDLGCFQIVRDLSHSCYNGVKGGCGKCNACTLRESGLKDFIKLNPSIRL